MEGEGLRAQCGGGGIEDMGAEGEGLRAQCGGGGIEGVMQWEMGMSVDVRRQVDNTCGFIPSHTHILSPGGGECPQSQTAVVR